MAWELDPPPKAWQELDRIGEVELHELKSKVRDWIEKGEGDDLMIARAITELGHPEEFSYWLLKEVRLEDIEAHRRAS